MIGQPDLKISDTVNGYIRTTAKWTRFLSVLGFITVGFMVLVGIALMIGLTFLRNVHNAPPPLIGIVYIPMGLLYMVPAIYLFKYSATLKNVLIKADIRDIEEAIRYQKSFWKFSGIMALAGMIMGFIGILAAIAIPLLVAIKK